MDRKGKGLLSYLLGWVGGLIVLYAFHDNDRKTAFHACQSITLSLSQIVISFGIGFVMGIVAAFTGLPLSYLSSIVSILFLVLMIMGIVKAWNDEPDPKLPVIGDLTEKVFGAKINSFPETVVTQNFDPNTGQPVNQQPQANFDPNTGQPVNQQPQANFDPNTGQPINQQPQANFDPNTGQPVNQASTDAPTTDAPAA